VTAKNYMKNFVPYSLHASRNNGVWAKMCQHGLTFNYGTQSAAATLITQVSRRR